LTTAPDVRLRFARLEIARHVVRKAAETLDRSGIDVMPLKGVLLHRVLYEDPVDRPIADVDLLVLPERHAEAGRLLADVGHGAPRPARSNAASELRAPSGMVVDLHWRPFPPHRYLLETADVFARATRDTELFGAPVLVPDPRDLYAHLLGKIATDHVDGRHPERLGELDMVAERWTLDARSMARHLSAAGLGRAARYTLSLASDAGSTFSADLLREMSADAVGDLVSGLARGVIERVPERSAAGAIPAHLLNHSLPAAARSIGTAALRRAVHRMRRRH